MERNKFLQVKGFNNEDRVIQTHCGINHLVCLDDDLLPITKATLKKWFGVVEMGFFVNLKRHL